ncbi:MAG: ATP-grasp domain-containing protein [Planctomycetota bacterium]|jgi:hypothetical protein
MAEDLRLLDGGRGHEMEVPAHPESPTWIVNNAWDKVMEVGTNSLAAYLKYCKEENLPHSYLLGLDILITGTVDPSGKKVVDIRPTMLEGPCCNSYPACPNIDSYRLYRRTDLEGNQPDLVTYPTHPTDIVKNIVSMFRSAWAARGGSGDPVVGLFTRPYPESEEETAHNLIFQGCKEGGLQVHRITPDERPGVEKGKLTVGGVPVDVVYRRIERIHVPIFYGEILAKKIFEETPDTFFINPWKVDDLRSKTIEERCFRRHEAAGGGYVGRPQTLLDDEISPDSVGEFMDKGGFAMKKWNSTGGKGVFLHINMDLAKGVFDRLYGRYDGRHMLPLSGKEISASLAEFKDFKEDAAIQQLRIIDARPLEGGKRLAYDTRINVIYDAMKDSWTFLSGISRCVPCGSEGDGNSLLTNVSSGAHVSPLIMGTAKEVKKPMSFGPLLESMLEGRGEWEL